MTMTDMGVEVKEFKVIEEKSYDFVIHAIVGLGLRKPFADSNGDVLKNKDGSPMVPTTQIKVIFELPESIRDDGQTDVISVNMTLSCHYKSTLYKLVKATIGNDALVERKTKQGTFSFLSEEYLTIAGLNKLLGKVGTLEVIHKTNNGRKYAKVNNESITSLHPKAPKPVPTRETFFFTPFNPELDVFKNNLTKWTQKEIMGALNVDAFPHELHSLWAHLQEEALLEEENKVEENINTEALE